MKKRIFLPLIAVLITATAATTYKSDFFEIAKQIEIFTEAYKEINMHYVDEVSAPELMDVAISAMFDHLDPYTHYWNSREVEHARLVRSGNYTGIGALVQGRKDKILIKEVFKGQPADKAGLKAGDQLIKIGNINIADFAKDAQQLLKGAPGTSVQLTFMRQGEKKTTTLVREKVQEQLVPYSQLINGDIGYIKLTKFGRTAAEEVKRALKDLKAKGAQKIILDLRGNPGGLLQEAVNIANLFLPKDQLIVYTKSIVEKYNKTFVTQHQPVDTQIPVAVLINSHSASASEIVSGSLQDLDRAVIVGSRSFGKGLVQRPVKLKYGAQMKLTISRYYTPSGRCIQALDYWHRDEKGRPVRAQKEDYQVFYTENGRKVYDAGGIFPDVSVEMASISPITQALLSENVIFDFATQYYYQHHLNRLSEFSFNDADFQRFKNFLQETDFQYKSKMEKQLKKSFKTLDNKTFKAAISEDFQNLMNSIDQAKANALTANQRQIEQQLIHEILTRYFYRKGYYQYTTKHNPVIKEAIAILNDRSRYQNILSGPGK